MVRLSCVLLAILLATAPVQAADQKASRPHAGHRHGAASLNVSVDGRALQIGLDGPADNLLGFEHAPRNDTQKKTVARAEQLLRQPTQLFELPPGAECQAQPAAVEMKLPAAGSGETHSEVEAQWRWECARPAALAHVDVGGLFKAFPRLKQLDVQIVTPNGQAAAVLKPGAPRVKLAS
jgi:Protein of unknown function (DUF2796)